MYRTTFKEEDFFKFQKTQFLTFLQNLSNFSYNNFFPNFSAEILTGIETIFKNLNLKLELIKTEKIITHKNYFYTLTAIKEENINFYLPLISLEFSLYPKNFINKINLKKIILCDEILINNQTYRSGISDCDYEIQAMIYSTKEKNLKYIRNVIHHELFHYYYLSDKKFFEKNDFYWESFNPKNFVYNNNNKNDLLENEYLNLNSFVSEFSKKSLEEDKAEIYSFLITSGIDTNQIEKKGILGKCLIIKKMLEDFDKEDFLIGKNDFWNRAILFKKEICDFYYPII